MDTAVRPLCDYLKRIADGDESWEAMVPPGVAELIKKRGFFGCVRSLI